MQGSLSDLPLLGIFDLIHTTQQNGVLEVVCDVPYSVAFAGGDIVGGGILDWLGSEALYTCSLLAQEGHFLFGARPAAGNLYGIYDHFMTEWARVNDEWQAACQYVTSPSRAFHGDLPHFSEPGGRSIRAVALQTGRPLLSVAQDVAEAVRTHRLEPLDAYAWFALRAPEITTIIADHPLSLFLDDQDTLGHMVETTQDVRGVREYLYLALQAGLRFPGCGWVLRDLTWEMQYGE